MNNNNSNENQNNNDIYKGQEFSSDNNNSANNGLNANTNDYKAKIPIKSIVLLVLSIINIITIFPVAASFSVVALIFGVFAGKPTDYLLSLCGAIYAIASIVVLIKSIRDVTNYSDVSKKILKIGIVLVIVLVIGSFFFKGLFPNSNIGNNIQEVELKDNSLLVTDDIEIKVDSVIYAKDNIEVRFNLNNKSNKYYNFYIHKLKVNDSDNMSFGKRTGSNFSYVNSWVEPNSNSSDYELYIGYDELEKQGISKADIKKLSFNFLLYYSDKRNNSSDFEQIEIDEYSDVEIKK